MTDEQTLANISMNGAAPTSPQVSPVLLYDGVCGFCHRAVQTILPVDRHGTLRFAALDSDFARAIIERHPSLPAVDSVAFIDNPVNPASASPVDRRRPYAQWTIWGARARSCWWPR
ncbi:MAG: putative thiol-disulfide oxidoreductase [Mycobacterium sp.]|jgi:hypothetical protein|nr:putative thiol-disulfide oxidoreductase [Mycobacterium sp.]